MRCVQLISSALHTLGNEFLALATRQLAETHHSLNFAGIVDAQHIQTIQGVLLARFLLRAAAVPPDKSLYADILSNNLL